MIASDHAVAASVPLTSFVRTARSGSSVQARCWISAIAVATGLSRQTVYRIRDNAAEAEAALARWA